MTRYLVGNYDVICLEDLNTQGLVRKGKLAKHISNAAWGRIKEQLKYKSEWYGKIVIVSHYLQNADCDETLKNQSSFSG